MLTPGARRDGLGRAGRAGDPLEPGDGSGDRGQRFRHQPDPVFGGQLAQRPFGRFGVGIADGDLDFFRSTDNFVLVTGAQGFGHPLGINDALAALRLRQQPVVVVPLPPGTVIDVTIITGAG